MWLMKAPRALFYLFAASSIFYMLATAFPASPRPPPRRDISTKPGALIASTTSSESTSVPPTSVLNIAPEIEYTNATTAASAQSTPESPELKKRTDQKPPTKASSTDAAFIYPRDSIKQYALKIEQDNSTWYIYCNGPMVFNCWDCSCSNNGKVVGCNLPNPSDKGPRNLCEAGWGGNCNCNHLKLTARDGTVLSSTGPPKKSHQKAKRDESKGPASPQPAAAPKVKSETIPPLAANEVE